MSRIGKKIIVLPESVTVTVGENNLVTVKGPKGELSREFDSAMKFEFEGQNLTVVRPNDSKEMKTIHGTTRALLNNMVVGVSNGYEKTLLIEGVGYRASLKGKTLVVAAGYSHLVEKEIPEGLTVTVPNPTEIHVAGCDKHLVGQFAADVRIIRKPEPYKGKGIRYKGEYVRRKEGKKAK